MTIEQVLNWLRQLWQKITSTMDAAPIAKPISSAPKPAAPNEEKPVASAAKPSEPAAKATTKKAAKPKAKKASATTSAKKRFTSQVTVDHIKQACERIDRDGVPKARLSKSSSVVIGGNHYPPKYVLALAVKAATGSSQSLKNVNANGVLKSLGFDIVTK